MLRGVAPPKPLPIKDRGSFLWLGMGQIDVIDGAFVLINEKGIRMQIPVGSMTVLFLEPGIRITHEAVKLAARTGTLLIWTGDSGVRFYAAGQPGGARSDHLLHQAALVLDDNLRIKVVRKMFAMRFGEAPERRSIDQLRGMEAVRVKTLYQQFAKKFGVAWNGRKYDHHDMMKGDIPNICISAANSCLYGLCEAAVLAAGYAPAIGFLHTGKARSFVFDVADIVKFETVVPVAFHVASKNPENPERETRIACRDIFRTSKIMRRLVPLVKDILTIEGAPPPPEQDEAMAIAFEDGEQTGDVGHRS